MVAALVGIVVACAPALGEEGRSRRTRIPHLDGTGRATIVDVDPRVPGAGAFLDATEPARVPQPGELSIVPHPAPTASPSPPAAPSD